MAELPAKDALWLVFGFLSDIYPWFNAAYLDFTCCCLFINGVAKASSSFYFLFMVLMSVLVLIRFLADVYLQRFSAMMNGCNSVSYDKI